MPPPISRTSAEPTLYEILSLTPKRLEGQAPAAQQKAIKQAYHKALLKYHPDKKPQDSPPPPATTNTTSTSSKPQAKSSNGKPSSSSHFIYTVDQIQHAYSVLSDARQRREYDRQLLLISSSSATAQKHSVSTRFHTGVETVDLDDLGFDERGGGVYFGSCRCGNARGFQFTEAELEEHEEDLVLMVQCLDCSLWMRVLFDAAEESADEDDESSRLPANSANGAVNPPARQTTVVANQDRNQAAAERTGSGSVSRSGKGWNFNVSFSWGISLSGSSSATVSASTSDQT
ncbi:hypothetical protein GGR51DRAFT_563271 [Nemania sp. FL0031]|nr:hypothetical protein GGR51DRAFT_563271 [Nemania sp. FL0031]